MDNLASPTSDSQDPFDTSRFWPKDDPTELQSRSNYDIHTGKLENHAQNNISILNSQVRRSSNYDTQSNELNTYQNRQKYEIYSGHNDASNTISTNDVLSIARPNYGSQNVNQSRYEAQIIPRLSDVQSTSRTNHESHSRPNYECTSRPNNDTQTIITRLSCDVISPPIYEARPSRYNEAQIDLRFDSPLAVSQTESQRYPTDVVTPDTQTYNNRTPTRNNSMPNNSRYGATTFSNVHALSMERNLPNTSNVSTSLANMSLDDKISESLNLRTKNSNGDNIYANSPYHEYVSAGPSNVADDYSDMHLYSNKNFEVTPTQQQFLLETKDYYTKLSTPSKVNTDNYEKNIYDPKFEDGEKLKNFSDNLENSKNYSAFKYQNVEYGYPPSDYAASAHSRGVYDEVNDTAGDAYSGTGETSGAYARAPHYANRGLYDDVFDDTPRPHRPAPPLPK